MVSARRRTRKRSSGRSRGVRKAKGKKWRTRINGKMVSHGAKGYRISPGTKRGDAYGRTPANTASRRKWKCRGAKSMRK